MRKNVAKSITSLVAVTACFLSLITASVAWFEPNTDVRLDSGSGSTAASYFESGSGTKADPYIISNQVHLYNLAWLQYLGQFNKSTTQTYFKLKNSIDMDSFGSALPPIGTEDMPFIGIFDGGGYTVSNLTVSNDESDLKKKPSTVGAVTGCSVVGFFGIVGDPANLGITKEDKLVYSSLTVSPSISDFYLENVAVESTTANTLIGVVAGYVGKYKDGDDGICSVSDIGVKNGSIEVANGATGLNDTYKETISKFSLIGDTEDTNWTTAYASGGGSSGGGTGNDWGGSIDTTTLVKRIYYMAGTGYAASSSTVGTNESLNFTEEKAPTYDKNKYNVYYRSNSLNGSYIWNSSSGTIQYLYDGTYLPLNVDTTTAFQNEDDSSVSGLSNWKTTNYYKSNTSEYSLISNSNTGYIVGGGVPTTTGGLPTGTKAKYIYLRKEINFSNNLSNSISSSTYDADSVKIYTVDTTSGSTSTQITSSSGFQRYSTVKTNFDTKMAETESYCYAIRFQSINATDSSNWSDKVTVKINGSEKSNYQFLNSTINFTVNKPGYITVIISSFMGVGTKMFDLFKIDRNSDNSISKVTQINKIYGVANSGTYYYDDTSKNSNLLFNFENTHSLNVKSLYYFEIPVNAGDYAIGKYSATEGTDTSTGYLNYLDIGANASGSGSGTPTTYTLNNVRYVHKIPPNTDTTSYADILFVISTAAAAGDSKIYFKRDSATHLYYYVGDGTNITVTMLKLKDASSENSVSAIWPSSSSDSSSSAS